MSEQVKKTSVQLPIDSVQPIEKAAERAQSRYTKPAPRISPKEARDIMGKRKLKNNIYRPQQTVKTGPLMAVPPGGAVTTQSPASIAELARALKNDPDLLFYHVYNQVEYYPTYGLQKGSLGALIDGVGNPWDQASLLVDLLREAGFTADFLFGDIDLSNEEISTWLGTDPVNIFLASSVLNAGGIPNEPYWTGSAWRITVSHIWVSTAI